MLALCFGEQFDLTVRTIDYRYIQIDHENTVREAVRSVNATNYRSLKREAMPLEAARAVRATIASGRKLIHRR
jgi:hypothetical protein